jgi:hypothetical protein
MPKIALRLSCSGSNWIPAWYTSESFGKFGNSGKFPQEILL